MSLSPAARRTAFQWLDDRLGLTSILEFLRHKTVPHNRGSIWYYFGGVSLFLFGLQVATGILLLLYYSPTPTTAYESVRFIVGEVPFGWLIRSLHSWAANLMVFAVFTHFFSVYFMKAYRPPRDLTWLTGVVLLGLTLFFGFSGYLLPWNELAFFATKVGTDIAGSVPLVGDLLLLYMRGGEYVGAATLTRFFGWHVAMLPGLFVTALVVHLLLIQRLGMSESLRPPRNPRTISFFPGFLLRDAMLWLAVLAALLTLCTFLPWELGHKADPLAPAPAGIRPEWFFTFMSQSLKYIPGTILGFNGEQVGIVAYGLVAMFFVAAPFLDRRAARGEPSPFFTVAGILLLVFMLTMTALAYLKPY